MRKAVVEGSGLIYSHLGLFKVHIENTVNESLAFRCYRNIHNGRKSNLWLLCLLTTCKMKSEKFQKCSSIFVVQAKLRYICEFALQHNLAWGTLTGRIALCEEITEDAWPWHFQQKYFYFPAWLPEEADAICKTNHNGQIDSELKEWLKV